jgi:hypothetical protein
MIIEHLGAAIKIMRPCEALLGVGREFGEHHSDWEYSAWVADAYAEALRSDELCIDSIRAFIRTSDGVTLRTRYDRVLLPWRRKGDAFVMGLSLQREVPVPE